jgi:type VI secretion system secreted protein VgrG
VQSSTHAFMAGGFGAAAVPVLPGGLTEITHWVALDYREPDTGQGIDAVDYEIHMAGGPLLTGKLDGQGRATHENVDQKLVQQVIYKPRPPQQDQTHEPLNDLLG